MLTAYRNEKCANLAAHAKECHQVMRDEWNRIKDHPSMPFATGRPGKVCASLAVLACSACKMMILCSPECMKEVWWLHKISCAAYKRDGENLPRFKAIADQFPWTKRGYTAFGPLHDPIPLAQFGLLGMDRREVGYWSTNAKDDECLGDILSLRAPWLPLSEHDGWRLPQEHIPSLSRLHGPNAICPPSPPVFKDSWTSYYQWRGLPLASPAALLLHWPLAVYACLKELGFSTVPSLSRRRKLTVHFVGAREELTFIPIFGELALLFPNTDLDLIMFGPSVWEAGRCAVPMGYAQSNRPCVYTYTAPAACGGGTLRVVLDSTSEYYRPSRKRSEHPDAIVALNASLDLSISWDHVIYLAAEFSIPFAVTDFNEGRVAQVRFDDMVLLLSAPCPPTKNAGLLQIRNNIKRVVNEVQIADIPGTCAALKKAKDRPARLNEFMCPAQRIPMGSYCPGAANACIKGIVPGGG
ncbi:hypothetical protein FB45DRAFT_1094356 [Roridomyces roridus]|uniref:Mitochondrial splicing suppressor 51-like C-terminal domain-containing protein n=1 Tax=Roridomyces roridus TaxID=1738132 RepID=A0AAD7BGC1_9AGAR|nr:hypothetical protein FB45DRAFT_1094356 [Roridomyces roridus]